jgi:hypothetical protein
MTPFQLQEPRYEAMRRELLRRYGSSHQRCAEFTRQMAERFPELRRVAGFYLTPTGASHGEHWWLETADATVVDPTADQWPSMGTGIYERYDPARHLVSKGRCPSCGTGLYSRAGSYPCSRDCDESLASEYGCRTMGGPYDEDMELECDADIAKYGLTVPQPPA